MVTVTLYYPDVPPDQAAHNKELPVGHVCLRPLTVQSHVWRVSFVVRACKESYIYNYFFSLGLLGYLVEYSPHAL